MTFTLNYAGWNPGPLKSMVVLPVTWAGPRFLSACVNALLKCGHCPGKKWPWSSLPTWEKQGLQIKEGIKKALGPRPRYNLHSSLHCADSGRSWGYLLKVIYIFNYCCWLLATLLMIIWDLPDLDSTTQLHFYGNELFLNQFPSAFITTCFSSPAGCKASLGCLASALHWWLYCRMQEKAYGYMVGVPVQTSA